MTNDNPIQPQAMTWWHRRKFAAEQVKQTRRENRRRNRIAREQETRKRKQQARTERRTTWAERRAKLVQYRAFVITLLVIALSTSAAVPFQYAWFVGKLANESQELDLTAILGAAVITALIEGQTWLAAVLYFDTLDRGPNKIYRIATFGFASIAASINFLHGLEISALVAVSYAIASLMGVGAWELYMLRTKYIASGMSSEELRLWASRQWHHRRTVRDARKIRATFGLAMSMETAWRAAYVRRHGNPTLPVAVNDQLVEWLTANGSPTPSSPIAAADDELASEPSTTPPGGVAVDVPELLELPVDWDAVEDLGSVIERYWPEIANDRNRATGSASSSAPASDGTVPGEQPEPCVSRDVPLTKRNGKRNGSKPSDRVEFRPTRSELAGTGTAKERLRNYLARAEQDGHAIDALDRNYIARQFGVSDRYVREAINDHRDAKEG